MNLEPIDTSTIAGKAEVMRLAAKGRRVRWRFRGDAQWLVDVGDEWDWKSCEYAIIAEQVGPDELFVTMHEREPIDVYKSEEVASRSKIFQVVRYIRADLAGEVK